MIDPRHWLTHLPDVIEAYFVMEGAAEGFARGITYARQSVQAFRKAYHLSDAEVPLLTLHAGRWDPGPFELLS
mgnify:CR=1 FL=1